MSDVASPPFNPLVALQSLLSADVVTLKQRVKAAQQLEEYFRLLTPTPGLLLSYEPYLPLLTDMMVTPVKGSQELQSSVLTLLQTLASHNPSGFCDWIARNTQVGNEPWMVQWSYALLLQVEKTVPRRETWEEETSEFKEFDRVFARVMQMWRTLLDHTADVALVDQLVKYLQALWMQEQDETEQWKTLMLRKLQTHFVDIADVFIGWMMSTGPNSLLREEILTLLQRFGRLWADNSVFSLQLLNSFADEIVNLCDSWNDHQEGDDDRLSTLVACFMMVSQCVPDLALPANEKAKSPFVRVLYRVASCPHPEYSLLCLVNCSDYMVEMSSARRINFAPLSVAAVRFLLYHCAVQSRAHDRDTEKILTIMKNANKLASESFSCIDDPLLVRPTAVSAFEDSVPTQIVKKGSQPKRVKVMECLYHLKCPNGVMYITQLYLHLVRLGGLGALKILGVQALQRANGRNGEKGNSFFVFAATCFILASRNPERLHFADDDDGAHTIMVLELITSTLVKQSHRNRQNKLRQLCLMMKMSSAFIDFAYQCSAGLDGIVEAIRSASIRTLECAIDVLDGDVTMIRDDRLFREILEVIHSVLSTSEFLPEIPFEVRRDIFKVVVQITHCPCTRVREECVQVMRMLSSERGPGDFTNDIFRVLLDLVLDPSCAVQDTIMSDALSDLARDALLAQARRDMPFHTLQPLHPSFVAADFENIMSLLFPRDGAEGEWNQVCRRIMNRISPDVTFSYSNILSGAINQAAAWCVQNRLRTHFGGPAQSFASIERLLLEYSEGVQGLTGWSYQHHEVADNISSAPSYLLSKWLLLEFMAALETGVIRAICTTDEDLSNSESEAYKTVVFFRTNKNVCDDWLNRIRPLLVDISRSGPSYELCRYHSHALVTSCYNKLTRSMTALASRVLAEKMSTELMLAVKDLDVALYVLCQCHIDSKDADSIIGFQKWGQSVSSALSKWYQLNDADFQKEQWNLSLFRWMDAMRYEAEMRYEDAVTEYEALLQPVFDSIADNIVHLQGIKTAQLFESPMEYLRLSSHVLLGCFKRCARCYAALRQWTKLRQFMDTFAQIVQSLEDCGCPIDGMQTIFDCCDKWSTESEAIRVLEVAGSVSSGEVATANDSSLTDRAVLALRLWNTLSDEPTNADLHTTAVNFSQLKDALIPLALQPTPWSGHSGEVVGKKTEETLLRLFALSNSKWPTDGYRAELLTDGVSLNPEVYDAALWSQSFCMPNLGWLKRDERLKGSGDRLHLTSIASLARKQHNVSLARRLLAEAGSAKWAADGLSHAVCYEKTRLLETIGMEDEGRRLLEAQCEMDLSSVGLGSSLEEQKAIIVQSLLYLAAAFLKTDDNELVSSDTKRFLGGTLEAILTSSDQILEPKDMSLSVSVQDAAAHKCLQAAIKFLPTSAKAWFQYSDWCYGRGNRALAQVAEQNGYISLDSSEDSEMTILLDKIGIAESNRDYVIRAFCRFLDNGDIITQREDMLRQICVDQARPNYDMDAVDSLVQLQRDCHSKVLRFYVMAVRGYGNYLAALQIDDAFGSSKQKITMVALRLLSLLTSYGAEKDVMSALEDVVSTGPVTPWSFIVPQLIARVHHPVAAVSCVVSLILQRLAHYSPHSIVYPAVVDSMEPRGNISNRYQEQGHASNTFAAILQELQNVASGQVEGVRLLISELRRISILWDEAWISMLIKLSSDVARRTSTLDKEATRVEKNSTLSVKEKNELAHRKLVAIMKPILVSIERLWKETCGSVRDQRSVSPHERKFLKDYGGLIEKAMDNFRDCCGLEQRVGPASGAKSPEDLWQPFADILKDLANASGRRDQLPLHDISPAMATTARQLALTNMPGAFSGKDEPITIHRVKSSVVILRTKTKPKSLELIGSDGQTYKYLLKAREDLRLDERIMQFLRVMNDFLRADDAAAARDLSAKNYSVIPLSRNAGLIQMVPDVVPLFQVYTSRNEQLASNRRAAQDISASSSAHQQPPPPTAQFYAKLKQHGIANVSPNHRAQWPAPVLKQVYQELVSQRPRNVLSHEILLRSEDLRESWAKSERLSKSLAVMSVLGYIVGLGDRHLDNILLCFKSGDIVHIDHNVCFDKGRKLKVPELVPFRLTPMLQDVLGFTGVEGKFRAAFEITLRVVRSEGVREALLTLFEAFVYSPLVDWIADDKRQGRSGDLKARLEVNVNLSLFLSRAEERRKDTVYFGRQYEEFADIILRVLRGSRVPLDELFGHRMRLSSVESDQQVLHKAISKMASELSILQTTQQASRADVEAAAAQAKEISARMSSFANECFVRHRQIDTWRQKSIAFAESDPETQLNTVVQAAELTSFQEVHAILGKVLTESPFSDQYRELYNALEAKCQFVDADVTRLRFEIKRLATCLIPHLTSYGHWRKELDEYLDGELKIADKDVYLMWWKRGSECVRQLGEGHIDDDIFTVAHPSTVPSEERVAESTSILSTLNNLNYDWRQQHYSNPDGLMRDNSPLYSQVDHHLRDIWDELSAMKLSNAQGQRRMKLAGASWIVDALGQLTTGSFNLTTGSGYFITPDLAVPPGFQILFAVSRACTTLLDLVSTPKGSMKRLRASELLNTVDEDQRGSNDEHGKGLGAFIGILQSVRSFAVMFQEEFIANIHGRQPEHIQTELLQRIKASMTSLGGQHGLVDTWKLSSSTAADDESVSLERSLTQHPAVHNVISAALVVLQKIYSLVGSLQEASAMADREVEYLKSSANASWMGLVLDLLKNYNATSVDTSKRSTEQPVSTIWSAHMDSFVSTCLVRLLRYQLANVISSEWKIDVQGLYQEPLTDDDDFDSDSLGSKWAMLYASQISDLLPSTPSLPSGESKIRASNVCEAVKKLMDVCKMWWAQEWIKTQSTSWTQRISDLREKHERRLRYAAWLSFPPTVASDLVDVPSLSQVQLLSFLSSQVPYLNALLTDQVAVEASVLELAQQMDYLASNLSTAHLSSTNESLHEYVHNCYGKVAACFEYGRTLADLVQGISVIETSSGELMPEAAQMNLEVNIVGRGLLRGAMAAALGLQSSSQAINDIDTRVSALQGEMKRQRTMHDASVLAKNSAEFDYHSLCVECKDAAMETARMLKKCVKEMRFFLKGFDKFKTPSKQNQTESATTGSESTRRQRQLQTEKQSSGRASPTMIPGYTFMENDRLVKILLRSIRSVNHLQQLEGVLERHGDECTALREVVSQIDRALRKFDAESDNLLTDGAQQLPETNLALLLDLVESLRVSKIELNAAQAISTANTSDENPTSLLVRGRDLVRGCVKLFFEATEMADRFSSAEDKNRHVSGGVFQPDESEEEQCEVEDDSAAGLVLESGSSAAMAVGSDSGSSSHDTAVSSSQSVEEKSQHGLQVLKRIDEKLSGIVTEMADAPPVLTVEQQASWLIDEATKTDNLCVMYEGWTPWI